MGTEVDSSTGSDTAGSDSAEPPADDEADDENGPANDFGLLLGVPLALIALVLAFVGPVPLLELFRYELPIVASFRSPIEYTYFAYVGGITFIVALVGAVLFPVLRSDDAVEYAEDGSISGYESDLAIGLIMPPAILAVLMTIAGFVFPAVFYVIGGDVIRAGQILLVVGVLIAVALIFQIIAILAIALLSIPLLVPSFLGAYVGGFTRKIANIGPDIPLDAHQDQWSADKYDR